MYFNIDTGEYPVDEGVVRKKAYPHSLPQHIPDTTLTSMGFARVVSTNPPEKDTPWDSYEEVTPIFDGNYYRQAWKKVDLTLEQKKKKALAHFNSLFNTLIGRVKEDYPSTEVESWAKQEKEAREYIANNNSQSILLREIAAARGVSVEWFANKVISKADQHALIVGNLIGTRQLLEHQILNATEENIDSIKWPLSNYYE